MRSMISSLAVVLLTSYTFGLSKPAQTTNKNLYFLLDRDNRWCGYSNEAQWKSEISLSEIDTPIAQVDYANDRVTAVYATQRDQAGDWAVYDTYSLDKSGNLQGLKRVINFLPGRLNEEEMWLIEKGKATKQRSTHRNVVTLEPIPLTDTELRDMSLPEVTIVTRVQDFPFWSLMRDKRAEILSKGKVCNR
ncbi:MAG: hypothetical protein DMG14_25205 [Acidobacteria bacterium]|nr:MAG: hypothetical protein DMG14_25205 [Acidobacteriota bacterium]